MKFILNNVSVTSILSFASKCKFIIYKLRFLFIAIFTIINCNTSFCQNKKLLPQDTTLVLELINSSKKLKSNRDSSYLLASKALELSKSLKFKKGEALAKGRMVGYFNAKSDFVNAVSNSLDVISLFENLNMMEESLFNQLILSTTYKNIGAERGTTEYLLKGLALAKDAEQKSEKLNLPIILIESLNNQGIIYRDLSNIQHEPQLMDTALVKHKRALSLLRKTKGDLQIEQMLYSNMSHIYIEHLKDYKEALILLNKAVAINLKLNN